VDKFKLSILQVLWGGLYTDEPHCGDTVLKNLLNAGNSPNLEFAYDFLYIIPQNYVKIAKTRRQSAGVRSISTSEASQRLHAGDLEYAYLVGLFEGVLLPPVGEEEDILVLLKKENI
jgi:hypothetical protein